MHVHALCGHRRKFELIETCRSYSEEKNCCYAQVRIVHTVTIRAPGLCRQCFRIVEDEIFNRHKSCIQAVEKEIRDCNDSLRGRLTHERRKGIQDHRAKLEEEIAVFKQLRNEEIAAHRAKHGVFADA